MKITIDLLPETRKEKIRRQKRIRKIIQQQTLFLLPIFMLVGILLAIDFILLIQNDSSDKSYLLEDSQSSRQMLKSYEEIFSEVNQKVSRLDDFQKHHLSWFGAIEDFFDLIPQDIYLKEFSTKENQVLLLGCAKDRAALIDFQNKLENVSCFEQINIPISNLVEKADIDFQMDFYIKNDCLKQEK